MTSGRTEPSDQSRIAHRRRRWLLVGALAIGALALVAVPLLVRLLNLIVISGVPLGFYLIAQGMPVVLALGAFGYAALTERSDETVPIADDHVSEDQ